MQTLSDELGIAEGWARPPAASRCVCKQPVVVARTEAGEDVTLDGHPDGGPLRVPTGGTWQEVATTADVTGRRVLVVADVGPGGQHSTHTCSGVPRRRSAR